MAQETQEKEPVVDRIINFPTSFFFSKIQNKYANTGR